MDKKMVILVCFFSVATFISSVIASCLVFYNEKARTDINSNRVLAASNVYKSASINYYSSNSFSLSNIEPGSTFEKKFSITNNNSNQIKYKVVWDNVTSNWDLPDASGVPHPDELVYSLTCSDGQKVNNEKMPTKEDNHTILDTQELKTNKTNECTIKVTYIFTGFDQSYNANKMFGGEFKVVIEE